MQTITSIVSRLFNNISIEDFIYCFEKIKENGDVGVIKFDGDRKDKQYTVFITFSTIKAEMIRADESTLKEALFKVLLKYIEVREGV
ncbi:hypothetical protein ACDQ55_14525 [Chitinophaga sp. 30R24]|uniref:hypothetical protein n=1 Tax=Chitinophaga sp. 30R24 TaxID=3248838 RepID=UPI003B909B22